MPNGVWLNSEGHRKPGGQSAPWTAGRRPGFHKLGEHGTIFRLRFLQDAVHVVFYCLQGEIQASSDFLVRQPLCNQRGELILARSKIVNGLRASRVPLWAVGNEVKQGPLQMLRTYDSVPLESVHRC